MCQQYESERKYVVALEDREIREKYRKHVSGEKTLTKDELEDLVVQKLMLLDN